MKKIFIFLVLINGINGLLFAQSSSKRIQQSNPDDFVYSIFINLGHGNTLRFDRYPAFKGSFNKSVDSLVNSLVEDLLAIKDSLADEEYVRHITVDLYDTVAHEIRFSVLQPAQHNLMVIKKQAALVKNEQDTLIMTAYSSLPGNDPQHRLYQLSFYLNDIMELLNYGGKHFDEAFSTIVPDNSHAWSTDSNGYVYLKTNRDVRLLQGYNPDKKMVSPYINISLSVQNYRNRIVPSFGAGFGFSFEQHYRMRQYWIGHETFFVFGKDEKNAHKTYLNGFLYIAYKSIRINPAPSKFMMIDPNFLLGYLIQSRGNIYPPHTFRLGVGQFYLGRKSFRIEPSLYFHDLFKDATPSLRITQSF
jgi:hypothetical protein